MAHPRLRRPQNAPGDFFVDSTCIDCDTCRWVGRGLFTAAGGMSAVTRQPATEAERLAAFQALLACPTASIGCAGAKDGLGQAPHAPDPAGTAAASHDRLTAANSASLREASRSFPLLIDGPVSYLGYASPDSFGAASYLYERPDGNVMVDSPRFHLPLARALEARGGIQWLVLTHRDDVADHAKWAKHFGATRVLHRGDVGASTRDVEMQPEGGAPVQLAPDLKFIPVPGHTQGHAVLLAGAYLFTGDHLEFDEDEGKLRAFRDYCWYDWEEQTASMRRLLAERFEWVLPGHGRRHHAGMDEMHALLEECCAWMRAA